MPKGPPVHEIFSSSSTAKTPKSKGSTSIFHELESNQKGYGKPSSKSTLAPLPPMKKFGGYKPKILGGDIGDGVIPLSSDSNTENNPLSNHTHTSSEKTFLSPKTRPAPNPHQAQVSKPKPFVIGDKDTPMTLSTFHDMDDDNVNPRLDDMHIYEEPHFKQNPENGYNDHSSVQRYYSDNNNNTDYRTDGIHNTDTSYHQGITSHDKTGGFLIPKDSQHLINTKHSHPDPTTYASDNPVFFKGESVENISPSVTNVEPPFQDNSEPEGVFIPLPDYEENEQTMEFDEEDPDDLEEEKKQQQSQKQQQVLRTQQNGGNRRGSSSLYYEGEDLSKYLSDDEDQAVVNPRPVPTSLNQKHTMFKPKQHNTTGKRKLKSNKHNKELGFNSVRNFSLADSKSATSRKDTGRNSASNVKLDGDDEGYESFLNTSSRGEDYETFLRSKHGVTHDSHDVSGMGHDQPRREKNGDGIWKKLTVRFRQKGQKNGYDMSDNQQY